MKDGRFRYLLGGIAIPPETFSEDEAVRAAANRMKRAGISPQSLHFRLYKRSVDARRRDRIRLVCTVLAESAAPLPGTVCRRLDLRPLAEAPPPAPPGAQPMGAPPLIVGMGPAGLFAGLLLARAGYAPVLIDRGGEMADRVAAVERFRQTGALDTECNVQFGAGGAGTFSDGKLVTRIHDPHCRLVLETLRRFGAPEDILTLAKPHIGTDVLRGVVSAMLAEIGRLGGRLYYRCRLTDFSALPDGTLSVRTGCGDLPAGVLILAVGHSARDTYVRLLEKGCALEPKPISVGFRAEHLQDEIDAALYGTSAGHPALGHAEYAFSDTTQARGVYTFCMCPGGEVVAAASEQGGLVVNGMSNRARDGRNANAAVLASVGVSDYEPVEGSAVLGAIAFQRRIEQAAFRAGGGDYRAPVSTVGDFLAGRAGTPPGRVQPTYRGGLVCPADLGALYPAPVAGALRYALRAFGWRLPGYDAPDALLTAAETRTSAPLRILRDAGTLTAPGFDRLYPCGEGAGYAGGITSAAVDGIRVAEAVMRRFAPLS